MTTVRSDTRRIQAIRPPVVAVIQRLIASTPGTISLGQGMVRFGPPAAAAEALARAGGSPDLHRYGPVDGLRPLVEGLADKLEQDNGITVYPASRVVVTAGSNMGFVNAVLAIADPGDEIVLPVPFYFNHEMAVVMAGCRPVPVPTDEHYQLDLDALEEAITPRTRAVVTVSPNNPAGVIYPEAALRTVNTLCRDRGLFHISDEPYEYFLFDGATHFSPGSLPDAGAHTISLYSFSKAFGFAGWRIGYMVIPEALVSAVDKIQDTILVCPPAASQYAAAGALSVGVAYCRERLPELAEVRRIVRDTLADVSDLCTLPDADGAMYYLARIQAPIGSLDLATRLIHEHRVAVIPGTAFGLADGCYLRISYGAVDAREAAEGTSRLARGLRAIVG